MRISKENRGKLNIALIMIALAVIAMVTATYAWFSLSLTTKVNTMDLEVTAGEHMRIDVTNRGNNIENWTKSEVTAADVETTLTKKLSEYKITPVTSGNGKNFYTQQGTTVAESSYKYLQFKVYLISSVDVDVYLTEDNSDKGNDGTLVTSDRGNTSQQTDIVKCIRISFQGNGETNIYAPDRTGSTPLDVSAAGSVQNHFTDAKAGKSDSRLFALAANSPEEVIVTIWLEGADQLCKSNLELSKFNTRLRFEGVEK